MLLTFISDLVDFKENRRGSPEYTIYLCFGERFPDDKPVERKLIVVKVTCFVSLETVCPDVVSFV